MEEASFCLFLPYFLLVFVIFEVGFCCGLVEEDLFLSLSKVDMIFEVGNCCGADFLCLSFSKLVCVKFEIKWGMC